MTATVTDTGVIAKFTRTVTLDYAWDDQDAPAAVRYHRSANARVTKVRITYVWEGDRWSTGTVRASGSRVRKDGTPYMTNGWTDSPEPETTAMGLADAFDLALAAEHRPTTVITWTEE